MTSLPTISVITPTIGRNSLRDMLAALVPQLIPGDEVLVVGDGPQPNSRRIVESFKNSQIIYSETESVRNYGNFQRQIMLAKASADRIMFIDDDDRPLPGALSTVRNSAAAHPDKILMFKMDHPAAGELWKRKSVEVENISGQMFIAPNRKDRLSKWSTRYAADFDFMRSTVDLYPEKDDAVVWLEEKTTVMGYAGRSPGAWER